MGAVNMKSTSTQITGKCDECGDPIRPASSQAQFNRNRGLHMWKAHGKRSPNYQMAKKYRKDRKDRLVEDTNNSAHRLTQILSKKHKRHYQKRTLVASVQMPSSAPDSNVIPAELDHCPNCHTRFFMAKKLA